MGRADDEDGAAVEEGRPAAAPGRGGGAALLAWTRRGSGKRSPRGNHEDAAGGEGGAAGTACRAGEVDGEPRRRTRARAGRGSTRGRGRGWRGGAQVRASEQGARASERAGAGWATSRRRVGDDVDLNWAAKGVISWGWLG